MKLREIVLGEAYGSKREIIQEHVSREVILNDEHNAWCHGTLLGEKGGWEDSYMIQIRDARGERRLHYHDLHQLLVIDSD